MRHPLAELSIDKFVPSEHRTSVKRPLSPGAALLSPTKRRILSLEGLYSLEKSHHTPSSLLSAVSLSPSRKLEFSVSNHPSPRKTGAKREHDASPRPETPTLCQNGMSKLQPSPPIASSSSSDASANKPSGALFDSSCDQALPGPMLILREMPMFADRHSVHWPGFDVHADTHIAIPRSNNVAPCSVAMDDSQSDDGKENFLPRRRAGKRAVSDDGKLIKSNKTGRTDRYTQDSGEVHLVTMSIPSPRQLVAPQEKFQRTKQITSATELELGYQDTIDNHP